MGAFRSSVVALMGDPIYEEKMPHDADGLVYRVPDGYTFFVCGEKLAAVPPKALATLDECKRASVLCGRSLTMLLLITRFIFVLVWLGAAYLTGRFIYHKNVKYGRRWLSGDETAARWFLPLGWWIWLPVALLNSPQDWQSNSHLGDSTAPFTGKSWFA